MKKKTECEHLSFRMTASAASSGALRNFVDKLDFKPWNRMIMKQELRKRGEL